MLAQEPRLIADAKGTDMRKNQYLSNLLATTFICGAASFATPALAQGDQPQAGPAEAAQPADDQGQEVVITGSRIPAPPNLTAVSPVTVVNSQEIRLQGTTRTEDLINSLPQSFGGQGGNLANGASGTATVNLRGLGTNRTMVLINGRRLGPGDPETPNPDINVIPSAIVSRVDVLTGGASSVYGSDAVSGVVNFIMDTELDGIRLDAQYSFYQHNNRHENVGDGLIDGPLGLNARNFGFPTGNVADGGTFDLSVAFGAGFDDGRGHIVAYAGYRKLNAVTQGRRDYSSCASQAPTAAQVPARGLLFCGGSATSANGTAFINVPTGNPAHPFTSTAFQVGPNRTFIPGFTPYNFAPTNYFQRPDERYTLGAFANYEISPALQPYLEVMFMDDRTVAQIAPSGDFGNTFSINCDNPLLSAQQRAIVCAPGNLLSTPDIPGQAPSTVGQDLNAGIVSAPHVFIDPATGLPYFRGFAQILRRNVEGGGRSDDLQHTNYRIVAGMRGDLSDVWSYDMYYYFAQTNFAETYSNDFSVTRLRRALDVVDNPATPGVDPVCRSTLDGTDPACVPYDIFATGQVTPGMLAYLQTPGFKRGTNQQTVASASLTGNLGGWGIQFPWANSGVGIALGVEYRKESLSEQTDAAFSALPSSDLAGQGAPTLSIDGQFDVKEAFAEVRIPIVEDGFFRYLGLEAGYRYSDYGVQGRSFSTDTYKVGLDFAPIRDIRFRAAYNRAVRAPNIQELFAPQRVALNGNGDPCANDPQTGIPGATLAQCQAQGVTAGQYGSINGNPAGQYNGLIGGNPNLAPEVADTWTVGIVLQPTFIPRLAITVDWFDIKIDAPIQPIGQDVILGTCVATLNPTFCGLIHRDNLGSLWRSGQGYVIDQPQNIGRFSTRGIDVGVGYTWPISDALGSVSINLVGTWLDKLVTDNGVSPAYDCAGLYGLICTTPSPEWRHKARLTYTHPSGVGFSLQWRYFSGVDIDLSDDTINPNHLYSAAANAHIPSQSYIDLTLTARIGDHYNFRLGVNNIFDREPPIVGANGSAQGVNACTGVFCSGNTFPNVYDAMGRYIFAGITLDF
jgi:outer membrane receptor protein involved in Fe transport